ncbi:urease accessory UreF family protein [Halopseudomonas pachastrellae]|nr:urease accessory UreF family protein [Halopseudomonas pachastrellae]
MAAGRAHCADDRAGNGRAALADRRPRAGPWCALELAGNQTGAATKLIPLGQTDAQRLLDRMLPDLPAVVDTAATLSADDLGAGLPGLAFASARHEHQYTRLFRS